ncbi:Phosphomethylpyrimidine kinase [Gracilaria domingensis]|nr:Phosphomethylpyrimidine kinase [Gracilaria domingensis]
MSPSFRVPCVLTVAGSDSGGGAGIQADLKTFTALKVYGASVITALTAQNTKGVQDVHVPPVAIIEKQLKSVLSDIHITALKTGMLPTSDVIRCTAEAIRQYNVPYVVVDPVLVATSGDSLVISETRDALVREMFPVATIITPNLPEAEKLSGMSIESTSDLRRACQKLIEMGCRNVLLKGGHIIEMKGNGNMSYDNVDMSVASDIFYDGRDFEVFTGPRIETKNTHGTGCTLAAALASFLAHGENLRDAVRSAKEFVFRGIKDGIEVGHGNGPLNHMHSIRNYTKDEGQTLRTVSDKS